MPFPGLIHLTAQYSNAVLVAVFPHITEFANKLQLDLPVPVITNQVDTAGGLQYQDKGEIAGYFVLTNGFRFWFRHGIVDGFVAPTKYFSAPETMDMTNWL